MRLYDPQLFSIAYTIDDGNGGEIHVNVSYRIWSRIILTIDHRAICKLDAVSVGLLLISWSTSGENIGDTGLIQSFRAWKAQYNTSVKAGGEYLLPGLNYTRWARKATQVTFITNLFLREQLFFIAFGRIWARTMKPAAAVSSSLSLNSWRLIHVAKVQRIRTDPHSPSRYRVDGTVSNIPEFAIAFNCPTDAKLNPPREKQCIFWG